MSKTKSNRFLQTNQRIRNQSGDSNRLSGQAETWRHSSTAKLRRGSAPELNLILPPISDRKTNRSISPRLPSHSPIPNKKMVDTAEREECNMDGRLISKTNNLRKSNTSICLSRNSSSHSINRLASKTSSLSVESRCKSNSLTRLSSMPSDLLINKQHINGCENLELKPPEQNLRFDRRYSDTPDPLLKDMNFSEENKLTKSKNTSKIENVSQRGNLTKKTSLNVKRPISTAKSDSNLTVEMLRGMEHINSDSGSECSENDSRIIEWLIGVEDSLVPIDMEKNNENENNIKETAIRIVYEEA